MLATGGDEHRAMSRENDPAGAGKSPRLSYRQAIASPAAFVQPPVWLIEPLLRVVEPE